MGTINGVLIGVILSFHPDDPAHSQTGYLLSGDPAGPQTFQRSSGGQADLRSGRVILYRFSSNLFFANVGILRKEIEEALQEDTKAVILDASAIGKH